MSTEISLNKFIKYVIGLNYTAKITEFNKHFYVINNLGKFNVEYDDIPGLFVYPEIYPKSKLLTLNVYAHHTGEQIRLFVVDLEHQNHIYQTKDLNEQFDKIAMSDNQDYLKKILHNLTDDLTAHAKLLTPQKNYSTKYSIRVNEQFGDPLYTFDFNGADLNDKKHILNCLIQNKFYLRGNEWYFNPYYKNRRKTRASSLPPTAAQLKYLDYLTYATGENRIRPRTMSEAGFHINRLEIKKLYRPDGQTNIQHLKHQINRNITLNVDTINGEDLDGLKISVNNQLIAAIEVDAKNKLRLIEYGDIMKDEPTRIVEIKNLTAK